VSNPLGRHPEKLVRALLRGPSADDLVNTGVVVQVGDELGDPLVRVGHVGIGPHHRVAAAVGSGFGFRRELAARPIDLAVRQRALAPRAVYGAAPVGNSIPLLERFDTTKARVYDEDLRKKGYGWRQFWQDVWGRRASGA